MFWSKGLLRFGTAKYLLNTVYYYNGKIFGLRGSERRKEMSLKNFEFGPNFKFDENLCNTFHGGLTDLKYVSKRMKHICQNNRGKTKSLFVRSISNVLMVKVPL